MNPERTSRPCGREEQLSLDHLPPSTTPSPLPLVRCVGRGVDNLTVSVFGSRESRIVSERLLSRIASADGVADGLVLGGRRLLVRAEGHVYWLFDPSFRVEVSSKGGFAKVHFECKALWRTGVQGLRDLWRQTRCWLERHLLCGTVRYHVTRLDLTTDWVGLADLLRDRNDIDRFRCQAKQPVPVPQAYPDGGMAFAFGGGRNPRTLFVYLKSVEVGARGKDWFWPIWGLDPGSAEVVRIEPRFQTKRGRNPLRKLLGSSRPENVLRSASFNRLWQCAVGAPGSGKRGWLVLVGPGSTLSPIWESVRQIRWTLGSAEATLPVRLTPALPAFGACHAWEMVLGLLRKVARQEGVGIEAAHDAFCAYASEKGIRLALASVKLAPVVLPPVEDPFPLQPRSERDRDHLARKLRLRRKRRLRERLAAS